MVHVYRAINRTKGEVYHGVSKQPTARKDGSHCRGGTKSLNHWDCNYDDIEWKRVSDHRKQQKASEKAHYLEHKYRHQKGLKNIKTRGI
jgi:hypothetical protein